MTNDEHHVALPRLYGAPAYARPPRPVEKVTPRPLDEDDLPLEAFRSADEQLPSVSSPEGHHAGNNGNGGTAADDGGSVDLAGSPFSLRALSRFISGR